MVACAAGARPGSLKSSAPGDRPQTSDLTMPDRAGLRTGSPRSRAAGPARKHPGAAMKFLLRLSPDLTTKADKTRRRFLRVLLQNLRDSFQSEGIAARVEPG